MLSSVVPMYGPNAEAPTLAPERTPKALVAAPALLVALVQSVTVLPVGDVSVTWVLPSVGYSRLIVKTRFWTELKWGSVTFTGIGIVVVTGRSMPWATPFWTALPIGTSVGLSACTSVPPVWLDCERISSK